MQVKLKLQVVLPFSGNFAPKVLTMLILLALPNVLILLKVLFLRSEVSLTCSCRPNLVTCVKSFENGATKIDFTILCENGITKIHTFPRGRRFCGHPIILKFHKILQFLPQWCHNFSDMVIHYVQRNNFLPETKYVAILGPAGNNYPLWWINVLKITRICTPHLPASI